MWTYGSILGPLSVTALQRDAVAFVLQTLGGNQTLDLGSLRVWLLALTLWLNLTTDNKLADLKSGRTSLALKFMLTLCSIWPAYTGQKRRYTGQKDRR
jgi:hypothetical protein